MLSEHALAELRNISHGAVPRSSVNPGVVGRLLRDGLVEVTLLPSPFKTHRGARIDHLRLTKAGYDVALATPAGKTSA